MEKDIREKLPVNVMFLGGVGDDVTGSSALISFVVHGEQRYCLVDAGGYQGPFNRNRYFPVKAEKIDFIIITHAHYDHIGLAPKLYKDGFRGKIYLTNQAARQGMGILMDAANIQEMEFEGISYQRSFVEKERQRLKNKKKKQTSYKEVQKLDQSISQFEEILEHVIYTKDDVREMSSLLFPVKPDSLVELYDGMVAFRFFVNPHQNGAVEVELFYGQGENRMGVFFSGDIGPNHSLLYKERDYLRYHEEIDFCVMESLHGLEEPVETLDDSITKLESIITKGMKTGKNVILVGFSLDRNAMLVYLLNRMFQKKMKFDAYFDSPLGLSELFLYQDFYNREHLDNLMKPSEKWFKDLGEKPFDLGRFKEVVDSKNDHIMLLNTPGPKVVITASANGTGGRVVDFFDTLIQEKNAVFVFCGWIYPGSPSYLLDDAERGEIVDLNGKRYIKHCETVRLHGLSSHGYFDEFLSVLATFPNKKGVFLTHAEMSAKRAIAETNTSSKYSMAIPMLYDAYCLSKEEEILQLSADEKLAIFGEVLITGNIDTILLEMEEQKKTK